MPTAQTIIDAALIELGVYSPEEQPHLTHRNWALSVLNRLMGQWQTRRRFVYAVLSAAYPFTVSKPAYTIGPTGADFTAPRPVRIERANLIRVGDTPDTRVPLDFYEVADYAAIPDYLAAGEGPARLYYQPTFPNGTLYPLPYPEDSPGALANQLELFTWVELAAFADLDTTSYAFPPGYEDALTLSLEEALAKSFGKEVSPDLEAQARKARVNIQSVNIVPPKLALRDAGMPGWHR